jgi:hypothetical protein
MSSAAPLKKTATKIFAEMIRSDINIRMRSALATPSYHDDLALVSLPNIPMNGATVAHCWFNCLKAQKAGHGDVVYGWALWCDVKPEGDIFFSQHHAVLRTSNGLVDITPYLDVNGNIAALEQVSFLVDSRVPFDTDRGAFPASLVWNSSSDQRFWGARVGKTTVWTPYNGYGVCKFEDENWQRFLP